MNGSRKPRMPSAAMLVAVIAVVLAVAGTAVAAKKLGLSALSKGAKKKTVGVGKLTYVSASATIPDDDVVPHPVSANCPKGLRPIGGGVKLVPSDDGLWAADNYLTAAGYTATMFNNSPDPGTATVTVACANSPAVTGSPPPS
jgi:hypothetical protein